MTSRSKKRTRFALCAAAIGVAVCVPASPAQAACAIYPGTNEIEIQIGDGPGLARIPATPGGLVGVCVDVEAAPDPQIDTDPTIEVGEGCGIPCFVVAWDGVSAGSITVRVTVIVNNQPTTVEHTIPAQAVGSFCINAGMPCPSP